jgi:hypothetical protein
MFVENAPKIFLNLISMKNERDILLNLSMDNFYFIFC